MRQPLRMISGHLGLLEKNVVDQLDEDQKESFRFAIDGAKRLDQMLVGLLEYSRVGRMGEPRKRVEGKALLEEAMLFLHPVIDEAKAIVRIEGTWPKIFVSPADQPAFPGIPALCRKIVEHHGGKIWAESSGEGQGSRFCFALPQENSE